MAYPISIRWTAPTPQALISLVFSLGLVIQS
jgi:hypothetical protein